MTITGSFITEPPDTINEAFTFKTEVTRSESGSQTGGTVKFRAVLLDQSGTVQTRIWSVNVFLAQGQSKEINLNLAESRNLNIPTGSYTLAVQTANYPAGDNWQTLVSKQVSVTDQVTGGNGDDPNGSNNGSLGIGTRQLLLLAGIGAIGYTVVSG